MSKKTTTMVLRSKLDVPFSTGQGKGFHWPFDRDPYKLQYDSASAQYSENCKCALTSGHINMCNQGADDDDEVKKLQLLTHYSYWLAAATCTLPCSSSFMHNRDNVLQSPCIYIYDISCEGMFLHGQIISYDTFSITLVFLGTSTV